MRHYRFTGLAAAALVLFAAAPAARAADMDTREVSISLRGVKLDTPAGQAILRAHLKRAAEIVCGAADSRDLAAMADMNACRQAALFQAGRQMQIAVAAAQAHAARAEMVSSNVR